MRVVSTVRWIIVGTLLALLILPAAAATLAGVKIVAVDGESMVPTYAYGDVVLIGAPSRADFRPGHVITIRRSDGDLYTHRVQTVKNGQALLRGDGNAVPDPTTVPYSAVVGAVRGHIGQPLAGVLTYSQQWPARISLAILTLAFIFLPLHRAVTSDTDEQSPPDEEQDPAEGQDLDHMAHSGDPFEIFSEPAEYGQQHAPTVVNR